MKPVDVLSWVINIVVLACLIAAIVVFMSGCNTFKVIQIEDQPDECNDFYTVMQFYSSVKKGEDSAFIGIVYNECKNARKEDRKKLREKHCRDLVYGEGVAIDRENFKLYNQFLECSK